MKPNATKPDQSIERNIRTIYCFIAIVLAGSMQSKKGLALYIRLTWLYLVFTLSPICIANKSLDQMIVRVVGLLKEAVLSK